MFERNTVAGLCESHLTDAPIPPSQRWRNPVSPELEAIILRCLEKDPAQRPQSVAELHAVLLKCPHATDWTLEERAAWWSKNVNLAVQPARRLDSGTSAAVAATVKIDLGQRSGLAARQRNA